MSGISGIFYRDGSQVDPKLIKDVNNSLSHRGPDGSGIWYDETVALGHQMLHTTLESLQEKLPFKDEETGIIITADARIDNREELSSILKLKNNQNVPDSRYILKAYQKWGKKCPKKLLGDFAFAIWDPEKELLFCARDHIGLKPFYYFASDDFFVFASEIKAILKIPHVPIKLNEIKVAQFLSKLFDDREITFYESISRLPAAHILRISIGKLILEKYWKIDPNCRIEKGSDLEYSENFLNIFKEAVRCRLRSAFTVGSLLSGGLDSSSVVCTASEFISKNNGYPLKTFSFIFEETPESDERYYINFVLKKGFLTPYYVNGDDYGPVFNFNPILWNEEEPLFASIQHFNYLCYELARDKGVRVLLSGLGGDSTVSHGKRLPIDLMKSYQWINVFKELKGTSKRLDSNILKVFAMEILKAYPGFCKIRKLIPFVKKPLEKGLINDEFAQRINLKSRVMFSSSFNVKMSEKARELHYNMITSGLHQYLLEEYDRISAHLNIELRYPFFDVRLIEYCYALPSEQKRKNGWNRFYMRQAMLNILPPEIQWRKNKITSSKSVRRNFKDLDKKFIEELIYKDNKNIEDYMNLNYLDELYESFKDKQNHEDFMNLWFAISLGLWFKKTNLRK